MQLGNIKRPEPTWTYTRPNNPQDIKEVQEEIKKTIKITEDDNLNPGDTINLIANRTKKIRKEQKKKECDKYRQDMATLRRKILSYQQQVPATKRERLIKCDVLKRWVKKYANMEKVHK